MKLLLDSVILIDHFNGVEQAARFLAENHSGAAISVITRAEVLAGFAAAPARAAVRLLDSFPNLPIDATTADLAAELRRNCGAHMDGSFPMPSRPLSRISTDSNWLRAIAGISRPISSHSY